MPSIDGASNNMMLNMINLISMNTDAEYVRFAKRKKNLKILVVKTKILIKYI